MTKSRKSTPGQQPSEQSTPFGQTLAEIRHDLRTPLNAIIGYTEMLLEDLEMEGAVPPKDGEAFIRGLHTIHQEGQAIQKQTQELLFPEDESSEKSLVPEYLEQVGARFHQAAGGRLKHIIAVSTALLQKSRVSSEPAIQGIVSEMAKIEAASHRLSDLIYSFAHLASPDFAARSTPTPHSEPAELAATSTALAEEESDDDEVGSEERAASATRPIKEKAHLLVVDDVQENRDLLERRLRRQGYTVVAARTGREALEMVKEQAFDLILLDIMMPEMNGLQVLEYLKSQKELRHIPVVVISAVDDMDAVAHCIEIGAEDYLTKPFNPVLLRARVDACLEKKRFHDREIQFYKQLRENYDKLREVEALRDGLVHMVVHDLRTPLTSVLTGLDTIKMAGPLNEIQQECVRIATNGGHSLLTMISDLLDISKMEANALVLEIEELSLPDIVAAALERVQPLANKKHLQLATLLPPDLPSLQADRDKIERILINLLGNAIKFTPDNGTIRLETQMSTLDMPSRWGAPGNSVPALRVLVIDNGPGIAPAALEKVFDKFSQVRSGVSDRALSTGLGLTFCKLAVEAHGGRIWAESELGQGSSFIFDIPVRSPLADNTESS